MNDHKPGSFEKRWQKIFQNFAARHDDDAAIAGWTSTGLRARLNHFDYYFQDKNNRYGNWLDAGCGAGNYTRYLRDQGLQVLGMDYSLPSLDKARSRSGNRIFWVAGDVQLLPFTDCTFRGALCFGVSQALAGSDMLLQELGRVAGNDAEIWVDGLNKWCGVHLLSNAWRRLRKRPRHLRYESPGTMKQKLEKLGWDDVVILWLPILPSRLQWAQGFLERPWCRRLWQKVPLLGLLTSHSFVLRARRGCYIR